MEIDLNADVGESYGSWALGEDEALIPLCSSVNVACGFHAGDPTTIDRTVRLASEAGVAVGAHPGYPDLAGFGRREMEIPLADLEAIVLFQVGAVWGFARAAGTELRHVKPHGALYNRAARDPAVAEAVARAVRRASADLLLVGLAGSHLLRAGEAVGLATAAEGFPDRGYAPDGTLLPRGTDGSLIDDPALVARRAVDLALHGRVPAAGGRLLDVQARTLCIHGDAPGAAARARATRAALEAAGITLVAPGS